jgi:hypothetical protein
LFVVVRRALDEHSAAGEIEEEYDMARPPWFRRSANTPIETPEQVRRRQAQQEIDRQLRSWPARRIVTWVLMVGGFLVAGQHLLAHAGVRPLPLSMVRQDIFLGYPVAAFLGIAGLMLLDPRPRG